MFQVPQFKLSASYFQIGRQITVQRRTTEGAKVLYFEISKYK